MLGAFRPGVMGTASGTGREGHKAQIAGGMAAIGKGLRTTGKVILTIPFPGQCGREARFPQPGRPLFAQRQVVDPQEKIVKSLGEPNQDPATMGLGQSRIDMLGVQAVSEKIMPAALAGQRRYRSRHGALSISGSRP